MSAIANEGTLFLLRRKGESVVISFGGKELIVKVDSINNRDVVALHFTGDRDIRVNRVNRLERLQEVSS